MPLKISNSLVPSEREARNKLASMLRTPAKVLRMTGNDAVKAMMRIFEPSPIPNHRMASGNSPSGEIGRNSSTSGSRRSLTSRMRAIAAPSATPTMTAIEKPQTTRKRLA